MIVSADSIRPSQDYLKPDTIRYIFNCIQNKNGKDLPPNPIVRENIQGHLVAIDGHNLIAVKSFLKQDIEVHLAHSANDGLPPVSDENRIRNEELLLKFESCLVESSRIEAEGIDTFHSLINRYKSLFDEYKS